MKPIRLLTAAVLALVIVACTTVEGTGRKQLIFTSVGEENQMGATAYQEVLKKEKHCTDAAAQAFVKRVGERIAKVADPDGHHGFQWEFTLLESDTVNAFCLPGGKVAVYTGILPYCQNEAGLAAVMGHEIGHAIARHGGERMTQATLTQAVLAGGVAVAQAKGYSDETIQMGAAAGGTLANLGVILPFSRSHESEADYLGLKYMAAAGFDPHEAVAFWGRFAELTGHGGFIEKYTSTHPQSTDRARDLDAKMHEALALYNAEPVKSGAGEAVPAKYRNKPAAKK